MFCRLHVCLCSCWGGISELDYEALMPIITRLRSCFSGRLWAGSRVSSNLELWAMRCLGKMRNNEIARAVYLKYVRFFLQYVYIYAYIHIHMYILYVYICVCTYIKISYIFIYIVGFTYITYIIWIYIYILLYILYCILSHIYIYIHI